MSYVYFSPLPHSLIENVHETEFCLIVKESDKKRIEACIKQHPVPGLVAILSSKKALKQYSQAKEKDSLASMYGFFMVDDRVLPSLKGLFAKTARAPPPIPVRVANKFASQNIRKALESTQMFITTGPCVNVRIARVNMDTEDIIANICQVKNRYSTCLSYPCI